jgi:TonB family protein
MADLSHPNNPYNPFFSNADDHLARLLPAQVEEHWIKSLIRNIRETINPPKLPPLEVTSKPVAVKDIWGLYGRQKKSFMMSTGFQAVVVVLAFTIFSVKPVQTAVQQAVQIFAPDLAPPLPDMAPKKQTMQGGGGGGDRSPLPASKGKLPKPALRQFTPPVQVANNLNPKLAMEPTIIAPPDVKMPNVNMPNYGDPLQKIGPLSNGSGSGGGIGSGGVTAPVLVFKKEPEYSEEARKAKYQGTVVLYVEVTPDGKAANMRVLRSLGLGLDEKAMEAVRQWKFKPGLKDGKAVTVAATIEVNFRLL